MGHMDLKAIILSILFCNTDPTWASIFLRDCKLGLARAKSITISFPMSCTLVNTFASPMVWEARGMMALTRDSTTNFFQISFKK